jgi:hypothetical protein
MFDSAAASFRDRGSDDDGIYRGFSTCQICKKALPPAE